MKTALLRQKADYVGITGSLLCIVHCLVTPVLVMTSTLLKHDTLRVGFLSLDYLFIGINILAVRSASRHTSMPIKTMLWTCLALFSAGLLLEDIHEGFEYLAYIASLSLVITHLANIRYCRTHHIH
ncbi:MerC domain-containing protein [Spirosoma utsteinense]|uniref:MerC domain-containing protein n=1 Tax=Spirosoma utsteinense TaxID=2585773 RepID=A0ABR6W6D7_9BACT|nr:MerC domain-containing protein [Spirosoma utsteinense]MBC3787928.1 hypothetical protein [Spirosoma utsteinense]MBC3792149.1 hypothetical protein [Spirosoma utsteinense]